MKFLVILMLCSASCIVAFNEREARLVNAVRLGNVPLVKHHLRGLERDGLATAVKRKLVDGLASFAETVVQDEESRATVRSKDREFGKIIGGAVCALLGYFVGVLYTEELPPPTPRLVMGSYGQALFEADPIIIPPRIFGFPSIYNNWNENRPQEMKDYYYACFGTTLALIGLGMVYDGICGLIQSKHISNACEILDTLSAQREELG